MHYRSKRRGNNSVSPAKNSGAGSDAATDDPGMVEYGFWAFVFIGVGRINQLIPGLSAIPLAKIVMAVTVLALLRNRRPLPPINPDARAIGMSAIGLGVIALILTPFSFWRGASLNFALIQLPVIAAGCVLAYFMCSSWKRLRGTFLVLVLCALTLARGAVSGYSGGRAGDDGTMYDPNDLAYLLVTLLPLAMAFFLAAKSALARVLFGATIATLLAATLLTQSRGGLLGLLTIVALMTFVPMKVATSSDETSNEGMSNEGMPSEGMPSEGTSNEGIVHGATLSEAMPNGGTSNGGTSNKGIVHGATLSEAMSNGRTSNGRTSNGGVATGRLIKGRTPKRRMSRRRMSQGGKQSARSLGAKLGILIVVVGLGLATWSHLPPSAQQRFATLLNLGSDYNLDPNDRNGRGEIWRRGLKAAETRPIGYGPQSYMMVDVSLGGKFNVAHNSYLQALVELGIPGLLLFLRMYFLSFRGLARTRSALISAGSVTPEKAEQALFARALQFSLAGNMVCVFFLTEIYMQLLWVVFGVCMALLTLASPGAAKPARNRRTAARRLGAKETPTRQKLRRPVLGGEER